MNITIDNQVPDFTAHSTAGLFTLSAQRGKTIILYFYPKDSTPGCTTQAQDFRDAYEAFTACNALIVGVSRDSLKSHERFKEKMALPFELLADTEESICALFQVMKLKNMYGKQVRGIERSTFIINGQGKLTHEWRGVKVPGHVNEVLDVLQSKKLSV